jgi:ankyrin repeat protein
MINRYCSKTLVVIFLLLCSFSIKAQTGTQAEKLMTALKGKDRTNAVTLVQSIDSANYRDKDNFSLLMAASMRGYTEVVLVLLDKGAALDFQSNKGETALMEASHQGQTEVVKILLDRGANMDLQSNLGGTALMKASQEGHIEVVRLLLERGANSKLKSKKGRTAYDYADDYSKNKVIRTMLYNDMKKK